ncbi:MAG: PQQ-binding-like beta-propeller repeat protein [Polyangiales bacterium]
MTPIALHGRARFRHGQPAVALSVAPDGRWVATSRADGVDLWDAHTGEHHRGWDAHGGHLVSLVRFLPDGALLTLGNDHRLHRWRVPDIARTQTLEGVGIHLAVSPDGARVAFLDPAGALRVTGLDDGRSRTLGGDEIADTWCQLAFAPDGRALFVGTYDGRFLARYDLETGARTHTLARSEGDDAQGWDGFALSPDGRALYAATTGGAVQRYDVETGEARLMHAFARRIPAAHASMACLPDGSLVVAVCGALTRWHPDEDAPRWRCEDIHWGAPVAVDLGADVALIGGVGALTRVALATGERLRDEGHASAVVALSWTDAETLWSVDGEAPATLIAWSSTGERSRTPVPRGRPLALVGSRPRAVSVEASRTLRMREPEAVDDLAVALAGVCDVALPLPSGRVIAWSRYHGAQLVDLAVGPLGARLDDCPMCVSPDGHELLLRSGRRARVTEAGLVVTRDRVALKDGFRATYSPDGAAVITLGPNDGLRVFDLATGAPTGALLRVLPASAKNRRLTCLTVLPDGARVVVGDTAGALHAVNLLSRKVIRAVEAHRGAVSALATSPDGRHVASGGVDTTVRRWDVAALFDAPGAPSKRPRRT